MITAQGVRGKGGQRRVTLQEPSAVSPVGKNADSAPSRGNTVSDIGEEVSSFEFDKVSEDGGLEKLTVEFCDTIDLMSEMNVR